MNYASKEIQMSLLQPLMSRKRLGKLQNCVGFKMLLWIWGYCRGIFICNNYARAVMS